MPEPPRTDCGLAPFGLLATNYEHKDLLDCDDQACWYKDASALCGAGTEWKAELDACVTTMPADVKFATLTELTKVSSGDRKYKCYKSKDAATNASSIMCMWDDMNISAMQSMPGVTAEEIDDPASIPLADKLQCYTREALDASGTNQTPYWCMNNDPVYSCSFIPLQLPGFFAKLGTQQVRLPNSIVCRDGQCDIDPQRICYGANWNADKMQCELAYRPKSPPHSP